MNLRFTIPLVFLMHLLFVPLAQAGDGINLLLSDQENRPTRAVDLGPTTVAVFCHQNPRVRTYQLRLSLGSFEPTLLRLDQEVAGRDPYEINVDGLNYAGRKLLVILNWVPGAETVTLQPTTVTVEIGRMFGWDESGSAVIDALRTILAAEEVRPHLYPKAIRLAVERPKDPAWCLFYLNQRLTGKATRFDYLSMSGNPPLSILDKRCSSLIESFYDLGCFASVTIMRHCLLFKTRGNTSWTSPLERRTEREIRRVIAATEEADKPTEWEQQLLER